MRNSLIPLGVCALFLLTSGCRNDQGRSHVYTETEALSGLLAATNLAAASEAGQFTVTCQNGSTETKSKADLENNLVCQPPAAAEPADEPSPSPAPATAGTSQVASQGTQIRFAESSALKNSATTDCTQRQRDGSPCVEGTEKCTLVPDAALTVSSFGLATGRTNDHIQVRVARTPSCQIETGYVFFPHLKLNLRFSRAAKIKKNYSTLPSTARAGADFCELGAGSSVLARGIYVRNGHVEFRLAGAGDACLSGLGVQTFFVAQGEVDLQTDPLKTFASGQ